MKPDSPLCSMFLFYHFELTGQWSVFTHVASIYANLLEQKKSFYMRKEFNSHRVVLVH